LTTGSEYEPLEMFGSWSLDEQVQSSTWRELEAVKRVSTHFSTGLQGRTTLTTKMLHTLSELVVERFHYTKVLCLFMNFVKIIR